ncbi:hypothetical protein HAX54_011072 [Datura stramonium]|uniref:Uncharacterized protein n=1 Tax=Datura stramonium TaxID=4076 RepID=A0ABS8TJZ9_DATST|nr:hypothetical protein [Datura stramonium]
MPIRVGGYLVDIVEQGFDKEAEHAIAASSKRNKAKSTWVKQYLCGTKKETCKMEVKHKGTICTENSSVHHKLELPYIGASQVGTGYSL